MQIDTSKLKFSTKSALAALSTLGALWQVQPVHDAVLGMLHDHPHWTGVAGVVASVWALLHDPQVCRILGIEDEAQG